MTAPNPLIAERQDSTRIWSGVTLVEGIVEVKHGIDSGSWVATSIGSAFVAIDGALLVMDPLGSMVSWVAAWCIEHIKPLTDALDWLAGDPDQVAANAQTWANIAQHTSERAADLRASAELDVAGWFGPAADAYRAMIEQESTALLGFAAAAAAKSSAVQLSSNVVLIVRTLVRDLIADLVSLLSVRIPQWTAEVGLTLGFASPWVVAQVSALAAKWSMKISRVLFDLIDSLRRLLNYVREVDELTTAINARPRGGTHHYNPGDLRHPHERKVNGDEHGAAPDPDADGNEALDDLNGDGWPDIPPPRTGGEPRPTTNLDDYYEGENIAANTDAIFGFPTNGVRYLTPDELEQYRIFIRDGNVYSVRDGSLFDTTNPNSPSFSGGNKAIFVMDDQGNLYASTLYKPGDFHHSSFLSGQPVSGAGEILVQDGKIIAINAHSGHYKPLDSTENQVLDQLEAEGIDTSQIRKDLM